eukprot:TRINITY_DN30141_c0_g1_i1.p1 TRINITY_DN30141_c0_g1~~TRINITY_DN30141_c0_g1_i1.p1  ORF type:complete len:1224 (+),score=125.33 TRINITY_DN30141_c0_g1_i1:25-3672(+)
MNLEWLHKTGLFSPRTDTNVLAAYPLQCRRQVVQPILAFFHHNYEQACAATHTSFHHIHWNLECLGAVYALPEDTDLVEQALGIYSKLLRPAAQRPPPLARHYFPFFFNDLLRHLSLLFQDRSEIVGAGTISRESTSTLPDPSTPTTGSFLMVDQRGSVMLRRFPHEALAIKANAIFSHVVSCISSDCGERKTEELPPASQCPFLQGNPETTPAPTERMNFANFECLAKVIVGILDYCYQRYSPGPVIEFRLAQLLIEALLRSHTQDSALLSTVQRFTVRWARQLSFIKVWCSALTALSLALLRTLADSSDVTVQIEWPTDSHSDRLGNSVDVLMKRDQVLFDWLLMLRLIGNPLDLTESDAFGEIFRGVYETVRLFSTAAWNVALKPGVQPSPFYRSSPSAENVLQYFGPWLFGACLLKRPEGTGEDPFARGRGFAIHALLEIYLRRESRARPPADLKRLYASITRGLTEFRYDPITAASSTDWHLHGLPRSILWYGCGLFSSDLPNSQSLLSHFLPMISFHLSETAAVNGSVQLRTRAITLLSSIIALPTASQGQFPTWHDAVTEVLLGGLKTEMDASNHQMLLACFGVFLRTYPGTESASHLVDRVDRELAAGNAAPQCQRSLLQFLALPALGTALRELARGDGHATAATALAAKVMAILVAYAMNTADALDRAYVKHRTLRDDASSEPVHELSRLLWLGVYVLTDWVVAFSSALFHNLELLRSILSLIDGCLGLERPLTIEVADSVRFLRAQLFLARTEASAQGYFAGATPNTLMTTASEGDVLKSEDLLASKRLRIFCIKGHTLLSVIETPEEPVANARTLPAQVSLGGGTTIICRAPVGKHIWDCTYLVAPSEPGTRPPRLPPVHEATNVDSLWESSSDAALLAACTTPDLADDRAGAVADGGATTVSVCTLQAEARPNDAHNSMHRYRVQKDGREYPLHASRLWMCHLGLLQPEIAADLIEIPVTEDVVRALRMLDATPYREIIPVPVLFIGDELDGPARVRFEEFLKSLGVRTAEGHFFHADYRTEYVFDVSFHTPESFPAPAAVSSPGSPVSRILYNSSRADYAVCCKTQQQHNHGPYWDIVVTPHINSELFSLHTVAPGNADTTATQVLHVIVPGMVVGPSVLADVLRDACRCGFHSCREAAFVRVAPQRPVSVAGASVLPSAPPASPTRIVKPVYVMPYTTRRRMIHLLAKKYGKPAEGRTWFL